MGSARRQTARPMDETGRPLSDHFRVLPSIRKRTKRSSPTARAAGLFRPIPMLSVLGLRLLVAS
jgi:hypothetical protein